MNYSVKALVAGSVLMGLSFAGEAQTAFQIKGDLKDTTRNGEKVALNYYNAGKKIYTNTVIANGAFTFEGTVTDPSRAVLSISTSKKQREALPYIMSEKCEFFIEGGLITVQGAPSPRAIVKAPGKSQKDFQALQAKLKPFDDKDKAAWVNMWKAATVRDSVTRVAQVAISEHLKVQMDSVEVAYIKANPASHVSLGLLKERVTAKGLAEQKEQLQAMYSKLSAPLQNTLVGKELKELIETAFKLGPGKPAEDFVLNDTLGNPVKLSSFKGKYVLLDFWASWCIPCRAENPTVIKAFDKYKDKNFTVISVSLEKPGDRAAWTAAILKDKLTWTQVGALTKEEGDNMRKLYGIQSIPMNFLIDPQGKVVAVHLRGEALLKKLEETL